MRYVLFLFLPVALFAADQPQATGKFTSSKVEFAVKGAYAYWDRSSDKPLIEVAVSNDGFVPAGFDSFYDPKPVIDTQFADEQTAVIYFQFEPNGRYHGMHFYLGSGDGCGFCSDSSAKSTVTTSGGRAKGSLKFKGDKHAYDISFDVPIAPKDFGTELKGDGGDIGAAYKAYNKAMSGDNNKAVFDLLDSNLQAQWKKQEKAGKLAGYLDYRADKVHWNLKEASVVRGFQRDNTAVLLVKGHSGTIDHIHGQVVLTKESGRWKISDEVYEVGE